MDILLSLLYEFCFETFMRIMLFMWIRFEPNNRFFVCVAEQSLLMGEWLFWSACNYWIMSRFFHPCLMSFPTFFLSCSNEQRHYKWASFSVGVVLSYFQTAGCTTVIFLSQKRAREKAKNILKIISWRERVWYETSQEFGTDSDFGNLTGAWMAKKPWSKF